MNSGHMTGEGKNKKLNQVTAAYFYFIREVIGDLTSRTIIRGVGQNMHWFAEPLDKTLTNPEFEK